MIVPMKKVAIIIQARDASSTVDRVRSLGVLHVEHQTAPRGADVTALRDDLALLDAAISIVRQGAAPAAYAGPLREPDRWKTAALHIVDSYKRLDQLREYGRALAQRISQWEPWGDFDPQALAHLAGKGVYLALYQIPVKELRRLPGDLIVRELFVSGGTANCAVVSRKPISLAYREITPPKNSLRYMQNRLAENEKAIAAIINDIQRHARSQEVLVRARNSLAKELESLEVVRGMGAAGAFTYVTGFIPKDATDEIRETARREGWGIAIDDPSANDQVPTLIRNPRWVSTISPLFRLIEILPGYRELDISLPFLVFFSIFFGILIGDAGYGLIYGCLTFIFHRKMARRGARGSNFTLFYVLSLSAIAWGVMTGTFFGQEWVLNAGYKPPVPFLNDQNGMQALCFFLGALHLSIAHAWRAILKAPSLPALSDIGWIGILWTAFFLAKTLILSDPFPGFGKPLFIASCALVIGFTNPQKNILKTIGEGLGTMALSLMNNFTDVISYLRLFAVGLAGVAIANAFNSLAGMVAPQGALGIIGSIVIVSIGHLLGVVLGPVSVLVHGVRLNVLEFSSHAGVSWSGVAFRPLRVK